MTKLRKQRRRKTYRYNVNRKRLKNKIEKVGKVACKEIRNAWEAHKSIKNNLTAMGLSYDPNKTIKITNRKEELKASLISNNDDWKEEMLDEETDFKKFPVVDQLEAEAKAPRLKALRLPKSQIEKIIYFMDKYGKNYKAMTRDPKNYYQETWKQFRAKIKLFKSIPEQYSKYLESRNLMPDNELDSAISSDDEV